VQKRSPLAIADHPVRLDDRFPVLLDHRFVQRDAPITYLHHHQCLEVGYCHEGSGVFVVGQKLLPFRSGDVSVINHTEPHLARSAPGTQSIWTWIYLDPLRLAPGGLDARRLDPTPLAGRRFHNLLHAPDNAAVSQVVLRMIDELAARSRESEAIVGCLAGELMLRLSRLAPRRSRLAAPRFDRLAPAMQYLAQHYTERVDVRLLADRCGLSEPHFRRLFQATIGKSPRAYWHDLRMRMAASLLKTTSRSVLTISQDVGFETLSSFNRVFRATFRTNPRAWRRSS
jgi:AraC-like DNA-binding protein